MLYYITYIIYDQAKCLHYGGREASDMTEVNTTVWIVQGEVSLMALTVALGESSY